MTQLAINRFVERQLNVGQDNENKESEFGGFVGSADNLLDLLKSYDFDKEAIEGYAPFVRLLEIHVGDINRFLSTYKEVGEHDTVLVSMERRRPNEDQVPVRRVIGDRVSPTSGRFVFYSHEQLVKEGEPVTEGSEWELISINLGPENEPMLPSTLWRNYFASREEFKNDSRAIGGSPQFADVSDTEFIKILAESERYWNKFAKVTKK